MKLILLGLVAAASSVLAGDFWDSCDHGSVVVKDSTLTAVCKNTHGQNVCSVLDLTHCVANQDGRLVEDISARG
jgi:CVNH domain